jgi:acyl carrier protein
MERFASLDELVSDAIAASCNCERAQITPDTDTYSLGLDSLALTSVAAVVSAAFDQDASEEQLIRLYEAQRVADIVAFAQELRQSAHPRSNERSRRAGRRALATGPDVIEPAADLGLREAWPWTRRLSHAAGAAAHG